MTAYIVHNENALGYIEPQRPGWFGVLQGDIFRGGPDWKNGPTIITGPTRPATLADFERFRVCPKGHIA